MTITIVMTMTTAMTKTMTVVLKARRPHSFETTSFRPGSTFCDQVKLDNRFVILVCLYVSNILGDQMESANFFFSFSQFLPAVRLDPVRSSKPGVEMLGWEQTWLVWNMSQPCCPDGIYSSLKRKKCNPWSIWGKYVIRTHLNMVKKWIRKLNTAPLYLHG